MGARAIAPLRAEVESMKALMRAAMGPDLWASAYQSGTWFGFLDEGLAALAESRATLQWSYATLFALHREGGLGKPSPRAPLFEAQQGQLENLSGELHKQLTKDFATGEKEHAARLVDAAPQARARDENVPSPSRVSARARSPLTRRRGAPPSRRTSSSSRS